MIAIIKYIMVYRICSFVLLLPHLYEVKGES